MVLGDSFSMFMQIWIPPLILLGVASVLAFPISKYLVWIIDGHYKPIRGFAYVESKIGNEGQSWSEYLSSMLIFSTILFSFSFLILCLQPILPLNPDHKGILSPTTIFNAAAAFLTNTDIQHYSGEKDFSNFSQIFFALSNFFISSAIGISSLSATIRALRGESTVGNFFQDLWRIIVYILIPLAFIFAIILLQQGSPMTLKSSINVATLEESTNPQKITLGPIASFTAIKMLGTNGGGFFNMNSAHPFENPSAISNFFSMLAMMLLPFSMVLMYGRMLQRFKHGLALFFVMLMLTAGSIAWTIYFDTMQPNPAFTYKQTKSYIIAHKRILIPSVTQLPVDQHLGNLEGKELRFGTSAGATFAALTTDTSCGAINAEHDSLTPLASISPFTAMWLTCIFGGCGVGMSNLLLFVIVGIFLAGMMVGRSPEYLCKKIGSHEIKLAIISLLIYPLLILIPTGIAAATDWGMQAISNPGAHGLSQILYQLSSAAANNGSAFNGLQVTYGQFNNPNPASQAMTWDIVTGAAMILSRYLPIIATLALATHLGRKKSCTPGLGTLSVDTLTFAILIIGTIFMVGALLFLPVTILGPLAEHLGPIPFGG